jgi:glycerol uptake facilitator-like aquaporin
MSTTTPHPFARRLGAEALGTALLMATVAGSGIMAERLAGGNVAIALLANALATASMLYVLINLFGPLSGAHFNPVVSMVEATRGNLPIHEALGYTAAQTSGALGGVWLAHLMFALPILQVSVRARDGFAQGVSEVVATFGLLLTILLGARANPRAVPALVACFIGAAYWFTASTSFANPAVTLARTLTDTFCGIRATDAPLFIVAQLAGAALAAFVCAKLMRPD